MKTEYSDNLVFEKTDVVFSDYLAHAFEDEMTYNIIFDIEECPVNRFAEIERELLKARKNRCWPVAYETETELINYLQSNQYKAFEVNSSIGLSGWVLAKQMEIITNNKKQEQSNAKKIP
jgi:hypothetical protein